MKRHKMTRKHSRHQFKRTASMVHKKNLMSGGSMVQRGGIRL